MATHNDLLRAGSLKNWLKIIKRNLGFQHNRAVFLALGATLQSAMIAAEVISIMRQQSDETLPIEQFNELYMAACRDLMPDYYTQEGK